MDSTSVVEPVELDWLFNLQNYKFEEAGAYVAIGYMKNNDNIHSGLILKDFNSDAKFYHLAFHCLFQVDELNDYHFLKIVKIDLPVMRIGNLGGILTAISNSKKLQLKDEIKYIKYGLGYTGTNSINFDPTNGIITKEYIGLTCSTFILATLDSISFPLIKTNEWDGSCDFWGNCRLIKFLIKYQSNFNIPKIHIEQNMNHVCSPRFSPEQVAASASFKNYPAPFSYCNEQSKKILEQILPAGSSY